MTARVLGAAAALAVACSGGSATTEPKPAKPPADARVPLTAAAAVKSAPPTAAVELCKADAAVVAEVRGLLPELPECADNMVLHNAFITSFRAGSRQVRVVSVKRFDISGALGALSGSFQTQNAPKPLEGAVIVDGKLLDGDHSLEGLAPFAGLSEADAFALLEAEMIGSGHLWVLGDEGARALISRWSAAAALLAEDPPGFGVGERGGYHLRGWAEELIEKPGTYCRYLVRRDLAIDAAGQPTSGDEIRFVKGNVNGEPCPGDPIPGTEHEQVCPGDEPAPKTVAKEIKRLLKQVAGRGGHSFGCMDGPGGQSVKLEKFDAAIASRDNTGVDVAVRYQFQVAPECDIRMRSIVGGGFAQCDKYPVDGCVVLRFEETDGKYLLQTHSGLRGLAPLMITPLSSKHDGGCYSGPRPFVPKPIAIGPPPG